ncbi:MAG TPA: hypothetical protein VMT51_02585 [Dongiaceae bacterium]|nr:hypothetical protein [Dongiaceae bacterium]
MSEIPTPSQTAGPFFSIGLERMCEEIAAAARSEVGAVTVRGRVLDGDGAAVPDALLEAWIPGEAGEFARAATNEKGEFAFLIMRRGASHLAMVIFMRGLLRHLVTRMYFPGGAPNENDEVLRLVPEERRETLFATAVPGQPDAFEWTVRLQGENETVFFDV